MSRPPSVSGVIDYDRSTIPAGYDRGRELDPEMIALWMDAMAAHVTAPTSRIIDLGCGTGRFSQHLASYFACEVVGIDPSIKMLRQALEKRQDERVTYVQARAEAQPVPARCTDVILMSMSFHHFADPPAAVRECRRVLRSSGTAFVRTGLRDRIDAYAYVPFFPTSRPLLREILPSVDSLRDTFKNAGFELIAADVLEQTIAPSWIEYAERLAAGADSILARLSPAEFEPGLAAVRDHAATTSNSPVVEPIDLLIFA